MYKYIVKRILLMFPALLGSALFVFLLMRLIPGDVCELRMGAESSFVDEQAIQLCRQGLDHIKAAFQRTAAGDRLYRALYISRGDCQPPHSCDHISKLRMCLSARTTDKTLFVSVVSGFYCLNSYLIGSLASQPLPGHLSSMF
jgi:hypothetical protein